MQLDTQKGVTNCARYKTGTVMFAPGKAFELTLKQNI